MMTQPRPIEAQIRPAIPRNRFTPLPQFVNYIAAPATGASVTNTIRPDVGELWSLNYILVRHTVQVTGSSSMTINIIDATTSTTTILNKSTAGVDATIDYGAFGNGPLILSNDFYITVVTTSTADPGESEFHVMASTEIVS